MTNFQGQKMALKNLMLHADDTTLMAESEEELKGLLMKVKEESEKVVLNLSIQKSKIMASPSSLHGKQMGKKEGNKVRFYFLGPQNYCRW